MTHLNVLQERRGTHRWETEPTEYRTPSSSSVDAKGLAEELRRHIRGEVRFDDGSRALYATDGSNYRQVPIGLVLPRDEEDVIETVAACRRFGAPVLPRGCGTSLAGQCCNVAVVIDFTKYMHDVLEIDPSARLARVHPGLIQHDLHKAAVKHNLTFGPDPATHRWCTIGGMSGNNSCGVHSQMAGRTADNIHELEILLYDGTRMRVGRTNDAELDSIISQGGRRGEIYSKLRDLRDRYAKLIRERYPRIPRRVSGYNLDELLPEEGFNVARALIGSEGTCCVILEAICNLVPWPKARTLLLLGYPDIFTAADHVPEVDASGPVGLEALDWKFVADLRKKHLHVDHLRLFPKGRGFLLVEFGGDTIKESDDKARALMETLRKKKDAPDMRLVDDKDEEQEVWEVRESGLGATAHIPGEEENWEGWEDAAVPPEQLGDYLRKFKDLLERYGYIGSLYGHFGQGCVHTRINFGLKTADGVAKFRSFVGDAADLVVSHGGSLSGEHGDGQSRAELLPKMFGEELVHAFEEFKAIWDPDWKMNPGKVVRPYRITENLRYGPHYNPPEPQTHFKYTGDGFSFARAMERCVGVGECRREEGGTMCPSYMVTREEQHSTRGRARLLFEMLQGDVVHEGWKSESVKNALDLCLSCKGCKGDCPVHVDMATYKAEFLSHYYEGRVRPRHAYAFGWIPIWSHLASYAPTLMNAVTQTPGLRAIAKWVAGIEQQRKIPPFAPRTFKSWFASRPRRNLDKPPVILFADTFNNYYHPQTSIAAVEVLESAGFRVEVPMQNLCCGRPLYDYGFLDMAERWLQNVLETLRPEIQAGIPFVVLEPSCWAVFFDEMVNLLPNDADAQRLRAQVFLLSDFLEKHAPNYQLPKLHRKALVQMHCHHKSLLHKAQAEKRTLKKMGLQFSEPEVGCCGMAGGFGFERGDHYDVAGKCGERSLAPQVGQAADDVLIIADGFSCREQIEQLTDRQALHLAEVIQLALHEGADGPREGRPEAKLVRSKRAERQRAQLKALAVVGAIAAGGLLLRQAWSHNSRGGV